jgi:hypothetical protein
LAHDNYIVSIIYLAFTATLSVVIAEAIIIVITEKLTVTLAVTRVIWRRVLAV